MNKTINKEILSEFVNLALASSKIKSIIVKQERGDFSLRPNINLFIFGRIGSSKSTLLKQISTKTKSSKPVTDLTYPALIGSIDKMTRQLLVGYCWDCRNSLMLLDEFNFTKRNKDDIRALLQLIEGGEYNRKLASFSSPTYEKDGNLYYRFENGMFEIKTSFSLILATMKYPYSSQNYELKALATRCICLPFYPTKNVLQKIAQGYSIFQFKDKKPKERIIISKQVYKTIQNFVDNVLDNEKTENYLRILGDCVRVYAIEEKHREDLYNLIIEFGSKEFQLKEKH